MRGAALKLGQALSIQEENLVPAHIKEAFIGARDFSYKMPHKQLRTLLENQLGPDWQDKVLVDFDYQPFAAASIGQVHKGAVNIDSTQCGDLLLPISSEFGQNSESRHDFHVYFNCSFSEIYIFVSPSEKQVSKEKNEKSCANNQSSTPSGGHQGAVSGSEHVDRQRLGHAENYGPLFENFPRFAVFG